MVDDCGAVMACTGRFIIGFLEDSIQQKYLSALLSKSAQSTTPIIIVLDIELRCCRAPDILGTPHLSKSGMRHRAVPLAPASETLSRP
jgi:hypothetical protein